MFSPILSIQDLSVSVQEGTQKKFLLDKINLEVPALSITALVGGSGSGKTTTGLAALRLLSPGLKIENGKIFFDQEDVLNVANSRMQEIRGGGISMIFQEPLNAFNPVFTIGYQIDEMLKVHTRLDRSKREKRIVELLDCVGLPDPGQSALSYPHQLSGGMRQRAMIAQAIAANPKLIIADEPTSNLDVTLQAHIIELFKKLNKELSLTILLITHDLGMVAHMADQVAVMHEGLIIEHGVTSQILQNPQHDYTKQLMEALLM